MELESLSLISKLYNETLLYPTFLMLYAKGCSLSFTGAFDTNVLSCFRASGRPFQEPSARATKVCRTQSVSVVPLCWSHAPIMLVGYNYSQRKMNERTIFLLVQMPYIPSELLLHQNKALCQISALKYVIRHNIFNSLSMAFNKNRQFVLIWKL